MSNRDVYEHNPTEYHGLMIDVKGNHPMAESYNYHLHFNRATNNRSGVPGLAELKEVKNPNPGVPDEWSWNSKRAL